MSSDLNLIVFRSSPYGTTRAREGVDAVFAMAVFEQPVAVLFLDDGVLALRKAQEAGAATSFAQTVSAFPLYDVEQVLVHGPSLTARGMSQADLCCDADVVDDDAVAQLFLRAKHSLGF